jgi:hypothetical protein
LISERFTKFELFYTPRFPLFFITGMVLLAVMGNMLTDWLKHYLGSTPGRLFLIFAVTALALATLVTAAYAAGAIRKKLSEPTFTQWQGSHGRKRNRGLLRSLV